MKKTIRLQTALKVFTVAIASMMPTALVALMSLIPANTFAAVTANSELQSKVTIKEILDKKVPLLLAEYRVPSISIARIENGKVSFVGAYGMQSPNVPASNKTLYNIASMTKPISAELILRLISSAEKKDPTKKLSIDEPMHSYWTDPDIRNDDRAKQLTPRLALSHQTGFPNWRYETNKVLKFNFVPGEKLAIQEKAMNLPHVMPRKNGTNHLRN